MQLNESHDAHDGHNEAQDLLPWLANGTLAGAELERVQAHLHGCAECRGELALLHTLRAADPGARGAAEPGLDMEGALARLMPQLDDAPTAALPVQHGWRTWLAANDRSWLRVAVAMQCAAIAVLAVLVLRPAGNRDLQSDYHMLGAAPGAQTSLIVAFKPETPERELRRIVLASGARIVGGPTATGAWLLGTEATPAGVVARLRAEPAVTLAELLGAEGRP